ncbi:unnamed protein product [Ectocarpus sp. 6 AP-2014]
MVVRATKLCASISKCDVQSEILEQHFSDQCFSLRTKYACAAMLTATDDRYILHVQRHSRLKMSASIVQQCLDSRYSAAEKFDKVQGSMITKSGELRPHGGYGQVTMTPHDGESNRHEYHEVFGIGNEDLTDITSEMVRHCLDEETLYDGVKRFARQIQVTLGNHNFICDYNRGQAKYLPSGCDFFVTETKKIVVRVVFANLVEKLAHKVAEHERELDEVNVGVFRLKKQVDSELMDGGSKIAARNQQQVVQFVSALAKDVREDRERIVGKKIKLYAKQQAW